MQRDAGLASPPRFLLFDPASNEGLSKQQKALLFFLRLAMMLGNVLVLPRCHLLSRHASVQNHREAMGKSAERVFVRWSHMYNLTALQALHPVVELSSAGFPQDATLARYFWISDTCSRDHMSSVRGGERFNGVWLHARVSSCTRDLQHSLPSLYRMRQTSESIAFANSHDELPPESLPQLRPFVRFTNPVYATAAAFVHRHFGTTPFLAMHWRRGDFVGLRPATFVHDARRVVGQVRALQARLGVRMSGLFLATDAPPADAELRELRKALQPVRVRAADVTGVLPREANEVYAADGGGGSGGVRRVAVPRDAALAIVEMAVCAMAPYFLGSAASTFSDAILEERLFVFGHDSGTGGEMRGEELVGLQATPQTPAQTRLKPLALPTKVPNLRVAPPRTIAEARAMQRRQHRPAR